MGHGIDLRFNRGDQVVQRRVPEEDSEFRLWSSMVLGCPPPRGGCRAQSGSRDNLDCGACVAARKNASAMLFVAAKVSHLGPVPQGQPERRQRVLDMVARMDAEGFGNCTNQSECEAVCPKEIRVNLIAQLNRDYLRGTVAPTVSRISYIP